MLDREDITIGLPSCPKGLWRRRPSGLQELCRHVLCSLGQRLRGTVGMTFADQRLKMTGNAGASVRQGWQEEAALSGDLCPDALARKHLEKNGVRHAAIDDVGLADTLFKRIEAGMHFG